MGTIRKKMVSSALAAAMMLPLMSSALSVTSFAAGVKTVDLNKAGVYTRTQEEIKNRYFAALPDDPSAPVYSYKGSNKNGNYTAAVLTDETKQNVLSLSNYYRWLGGYTGFTLNENDNIWDYAEKGSVLLSVSNFSHTPNKPDDMSDAFYNSAYLGTSNSSIAYIYRSHATGQDALLYTLRLWLDDDGYDIPGHRDTFFTRNGYKLAYGMFTDDSTGKICSCQTVGYYYDPNPSGKSKVGNDEAAYAWPAPGYFPSDDLSVKAPWTITLNTDELRYSSLSDLTVTVKNDATGAVDTRKSGSGLYDTTYWGRTISFEHPTISDSTYLGNSYTVTVSGLKDGSGAAAQLTYNVNFFSYYDFSNTSAVYPEKAKTDDKISIKLDVQGAKGSTHFDVYYQWAGSSTWKTFFDADEPGTYTTTFPSEGKYGIKIVASDTSGHSEEKIFYVNVYDEIPVVPELVNRSGVDNPDITLGDTVSITGAAEGGEGQYTYSYYYKKSSKTEWICIGEEDSTLTSAQFTPGSAVPYDVMVVVKDGSSTVSKTFSVNVKNIALANKCTISTTSVKTGEKVVLKGAAAGGTAPYTYAFYYKKCTSSEWISMKEPFTTKSASFKPGSAVGYDVKTVVRDANGDEKTKSFTVYAYKSALVCNPTLNADTVRTGEKVVIKGGASGGTSPYKYAFYYKKSKNTSWTLIGTAYTTKSAAFRPGSATAYDIKVIVKDLSGKTNTKLMTVYVKK